MNPRALLAEVDRRLARLYGDPHPGREKPLTLLVRTILSQNTSDRNRDQAFDALRSRWGTWEQVLDAPTGELAKAIKPAGLHHQRARRLHTVLERIQSERGELSLGFLAGMPPEEAEAWLLSLPGVGKKTAYVVLLMGFGIPRFPVDTHIQRVTSRLGLLPPRVEPHVALAPLVPAGREEPLHLSIIRLGREVCAARRPRCPACTLPDLCAHVLVKADPTLRAALRNGKVPPVLARRRDDTVSPSRPDRGELLALLSDPEVVFVEAAARVSPKEVR